MSRFAKRIAYTAAFGDDPLIKLYITGQRVAHTGMWHKFYSSTDFRTYFCLLPYTKDGVWVNEDKLLFTTKNKMEAFCARVGITLTPME